MLVSLTVKEYQENFCLLVPFFSQMNSTWKEDFLGGDPSCGKISAKGCALTSAAMVMKYYECETNPGRLNENLGRTGYDDNCSLLWANVPGAAECSDDLKIDFSYYENWWKDGNWSVLKSAIKSQLDNGNPVIAKVTHEKGTHFIVFIGHGSLVGNKQHVYYFLDPLV